jgi:SNF2 family DNA or RNA helicase
MMIYKPYEYQTAASNFIKEHDACALLLDMGLGKTVITLTSVKELIRSGEVKRVLIIAPLRVAQTTWPSEIKKWNHLSDLTYRVATGTEKQRISALSDNADLYIINRENVDWLINNNAIKFNFDMVVVDELSSFKSYQAKRFKSLLKVRWKIKRIVGLTGTPSSNGLMDLWAEYKILDQGERLGKFITHYREKYFDPDKRNANVIFSYKLKPFAEEAIYSKIDDITISMKAVDYLKMPPILYNEIKVELDQKERKIYEILKKDMIVALEDKEIDAMNAASLSNKLLQMANGSVYGEEKEVIHLHDKKLDTLEEIVEAANGNSVLCAFWYKHDLERIKARFGDKCQEINSEASIRKWNSGDIQIGLIHPMSAGHGLNLQSGGSILVWFGLTWSLELYQQTIGRLYRQGQTRSVIIHHIVSKDTIDERVMLALKNKEVSQDALIRAVKAEVGL